MVGQEKLKSLPEENKEKIAECQEQRTKLEKRVEEEETNYEAAMANLKQETQVPVQCLVCWLRTPYMQKCQFFYVFTIRQGTSNLPPKVPCGISSKHNFIAPLKNILFLNYYTFKLLIFTFFANVQNMYKDEKRRTEMKSALSN